MYIDLTERITKYKRLHMNHVITQDDMIHTLRVLISLPYDDEEKLKQSFYKTVEEYVIYISANFDSISFSSFSSSIIEENNLKQLYLQMIQYFCAYSLSIDSQIPSLINSFRCFLSLFARFEQEKCLKVSG